MMEGNNTLKNYSGSNVAPGLRSCLCRRFTEWSSRRIKTQSEGIGAAVFLRENAACM